MPSIYTKWCDLCGLDFKALSPFAKICPKCKKVKFKKPAPTNGHISGNLLTSFKMVEIAQRAKN